MVPKSKQPSSTSGLKGKQVYIDHLEMALEQLADKYPHLEIGTGNGTYRQRAVIKKQIVLKKTQVSKNSNNNNNKIKSGRIVRDDQKTILPTKVAHKSTFKAGRGRGRRGTRNTPMRTIIANKTDNETYTTIAKPGTAGSKQALLPPRGRARRQNGITQEPNDSTPYLIDTNHMVNDTIVSYLEELCERAHMKELPSDAEKLCKNFVVLIPNLDLNDVDYDFQDVEKNQDQSD